MVSMPRLFIVISAFALFLPSMWAHATKVSVPSFCSFTLSADPNNRSGREILARMSRLVVAVADPSAVKFGSRLVPEHPPP